jgi:hypothetical protein
VRKDRSAEKRVVGFAGGLQGAYVGGVGLVGLAQVEELDASGEQQRFG